MKESLSFLLMFSLPLLRYHLMSLGMYKHDSVSAQEEYFAMNYLQQRPEPNAFSMPMETLCSRQVDLEMSTQVCHCVSVAIGQTRWEDQHDRIVL